MAIITNDNAATLDFSLKRGATLQQYFRFKSSNGEYIDLTNVELKMDVVNVLGHVVLSFSIGNGFSLLNSTTLAMDLKLEQRELVPGSYKYDFKMMFPDSVEYSLAGNYYVKANITH